MGMQYILAHDLGTSGNKACLFDEKGSLLGSAYETYPTYFDQEGYAEQSPEDWWMAVKKTSRQVMEQAGIDAKNVAAISFSAQSLGCVPVDEKGNLLRQRTMIWMDARAVEQSRAIIAQYGARKHYETTGNSFDVALYPCSKILWLKQNEPEVYEKAYKFIGTKEYIIAKLTGEVGLTDYSEAGMSGMFNLLKHDYEDEILSIAGIERDKLCRPVVNTHIVGQVLPGLQEETGLTPHTAVVMGTLDNLACATGAGCMNQGTFVTCIGTAAWTGVNDSKPLMSPDFQSNVMYVGNGVYHTSMHSHSAAVVYDWVLDNMLASFQRNYDEIEQLARKAGPGAEKLLLLPSFQSGNTIYSSVNLAGSFLGLRLHHGPGHIARAAMEGVGLDLMMGVEFFASMGCRPAAIRAIGGGSKSKLWREILADMLHANIEVPQNMQHIGALGAAAIAGVGVGLFQDFSVVDQLITPSGMIQPQEENHALYKKILPVFKKSYESVMPIYDQMEQVYQQ